jgi:iron complex transport system substrate-binding protein
MKFLFSLLSVALLALPAQAAERIVSTAGAVTETIFALGAQDEVVAVDVSSVYPEAATKLPKVGYARQLSAEGILSMNPTQVIVTEDAGPPEVIDQVEKAGVKVVRLSNKHTPEAAVERILQIGEALGRKAEAEKLAATVKTELAEAAALVAATSSKPSVLFIYARGGGTMNVSGTGTSADAIITLAGGKNAVNGYENYKPLTAEGAVAAAPDVILVTSRGLEASGGVEGLLKQPGLALTPAGKAGRVIALDDLYLLGFGPRLGQAVKELCTQLHAAPQSAQR